MGMTPLEGLVMGTRPGDVDPGVITFMSSHLGYSTGDAHPSSPDTTPPPRLIHPSSLLAEAIEKLLNKQSGLLGLCGTSDMRSVRAAAEKGRGFSIAALM